MYELGNDTYLLINGYFFYNIILYKNSPRRWLFSTLFVLSDKTRYLQNIYRKDLRVKRRELCIQF